MGKRPVLKVRAPCIPCFTFDRFHLLIRSSGTLG
jgi:hypothetical protein